MATQVTAPSVPAVIPPLLHVNPSGGNGESSYQRSRQHGCVDLLGIPIRTCNLEQTAHLVTDWAHQKTQTRLVTFTNVHMLTESHYIPGFRSQLRQMDLNCMDGMPLVWLGRLAGQRVSRVCGPEFFEEFFASTTNEGLRHFFYGGKEGVAEKVAAEFSCRYPGLQVAGCGAPPFRSLTSEEDALIVKTMNDSNADIVWVSLGCPKQETWLYEHRHKLKPCVLLAVGQAFDIVVGEKKRAPQLICNAGFEWLYRLLKEPRRLGTRYAKSNLTFLFLVLADASKRAVSRSRSHSAL